ncbi:DUF995 domain containing protein [Sulfitobacter noctilucicola]|uniref:DUF995 domain-containing protein n=1 Tax=Sulfitobacter noctilucicola TaxID=1342301 RepID=A0A7W6M635_9RHOB|nr:DUF995 domain-containing protein [Sulfitobacter noctilucicola]KIN62398.1 DUF995 domain containing protein [Sulfitobacter noctilucicola]MBB4173069.1 hypothetical protein [Sulfitobacter noctilucicola]
MYFRKSIYLVGFVAATTFGATTLHADPKPKNTKATDSQTVANFYAGTSRLWKSCKPGGVYLGGGWEAQAYCKRKSESVSVGKWSVKRGVLCIDLVHYWQQGDGVGSKPNDDRECIAHITDADGQIWRSWNDDGDWWRLQAVKDDKGAAKGFKLKSKVTRLRKKLGV